VPVFPSLTISCAIVGSGCLGWLWRGTGRAATTPRRVESAPRRSLAPRRRTLHRPAPRTSTASGSLQHVLQHRRGTPPRACIKGLISLCEFRFRGGPNRRRWGPHHDAHFRRLIRVLDQVSKGSHFGAEPQCTYPPEPAAAVRWLPTNPGVRPFRGARARGLRNGYGVSPQS